MSNPTVDFLKVVLIFALVLSLIRNKVNLGIAMAVSAVALGLLFQVPPVQLGRIALESTFDVGTLELAAALVLIMFLERLMRRALLLQKMVSAVTVLAKDRRIAMAMLPAFIGLLPSVGGAYFSAPMVDEASQGLTLSAERKSFINLWYRHLWEWVSPLYPSVILTAQIAQVPLDKIIATQLPFTLVAVLVGIPIGFHGIGGQFSSGAGVDRRQHLRNLATGLGPILAIMVMVIVLRINIAIALLLAGIGVTFLGSYSPAGAFKVIREAFSPSLVLLVLGIMFFKWVLMRTGAVESLPAFFGSIGIPLLLVVFLLPFIVGAMTGILQAPVGITIPIVAGLGGAGGADLRLVSFAFVSAFAGVMVSPAHMCIVLTVEHFKADFGKVARLMLIPLSAIVLAGALLYLLSRG
ncbi:MAG: DUF401 family protein [Chloroflexi bacterium]|nr:DUF401 family protein [Chloroflexota bacterium]